MAREALAGRGCTVRHDGPPASRRRLFHARRSRIGVVPPALDGAVISGARRVQRGLKILGLPVTVALQVSPPMLRLGDTRLGVGQRASRRVRLRLGRRCAGQRRITHLARHHPGRTGRDHCPRPVRPPPGWAPRHRRDDGRADLLAATDQARPGEHPGGDVIRHPIPSDGRVQAGLRAQRSADPLRKGRHRHRSRRQDEIMKHCEVKKGE